MEYVSAIGTSVLAKSILAPDVDSVASNSPGCPAFSDRITSYNVCYTKLLRIS